MTDKPNAIRRFFGEYRFLSNFYPVNLTMDGLEYPSVEHAYQAAKSASRKDRKAISECATPGEAKKLGQKVEMRPDWDEVKIPIMRSLLKKKFSYRRLKKALLETGDAYLEEGNTWGDRFWGVCNSIGENHLGKLLMEIREEL